MADILQASSPTPHAELVEEPQEQKEVVVWTMGASPEVIQLPPVIKVPIVSTAGKLKPLSHGSDQSSTGIFEVQDGEMHINQREEPSSVKARIAYSVLLLITGVALIAVGVITEMKAEMPGRGVPFWVVGSLLTIPGLYCTWDSVVTYRQLGNTERQNIFKDESERVLN